MEGPILAEFSNLNSLHTKAAYGAPPREEAQGRSAAQGPSGSRTDRSSDRPHGHHHEDHERKERLLRGESTYTAASSEGRINEHFIEDQPQGINYGVSNVMPQASTTEERERLLRRLEMCAKAREESTKIMSIRFAQRDAVKADLRRERNFYNEKLTASQRDRDERWSRKLQRSPFAVDLVAENQRIDEENRVRDHVEQRRQRLMARRNREAHNAIFKRATTDVDELDQLRTEKRLLLENEKQLKALRDVEKSNARTAQILQERRKQQLTKQQAQLQQAVGGQQDPPWTHRTA